MIKFWTGFDDNRYNPCCDCSTGINIYLDFILIPIGLGTIRGILK